MTAREFFESLPGKVNADAVKDMQTVFHFDLSGEGGGQYTLRLQDGQLSIEEGLQGDAKCVVRSSAEDFMALVTGKLNPMMAMMTGKVKISNPSEMVKYAKLFGLM